MKDLEGRIASSGDRAGAPSGFSRSASEAKPLVPLRDDAERSAVIAWLHNQFVAERGMAADYAENGSFGNAHEAQQRALAYRTAAESIRRGDHR